MLKQNLKKKLLGASPKNLLMWPLLSFLLLIMNGCDGAYWDEKQAQLSMLLKGTLTVITVRDPTMVLKSENGEIHGLEAELLLAFAHHYSLPIRFEMHPNPESARKAFEEGHGDILAARLEYSLPLKTWREGPAYEETQLALYCHSEQAIDSIKDLDFKKVILTEPYLPQALQRSLQFLAPHLTTISIPPERTTLEAFSQVQEKVHPCIISEKKQGNYYSQLFPKIQFIGTLFNEYSLHWWMREEHRDLVALTHSWFQKASRSGEARRIQEKNEALLGKIHPLNAQLFLKNLKKRLPLYKQHFMNSSSTESLSWEMIAALSFQESQWSSTAKSFTGVEGFMQLTQETAQSMGVLNRRNTQESIAGGSKYLRHLLNRSPSHWPQSEKIIWALLSYNLGPKHLLDVEEISQNKKLLPYHWPHLLKILPLLSQESPSIKLNYGKARGEEALQFVERVRGYYDLVLLTESKETNSKSESLDALEKKHPLSMKNSKESSAYF